MTTFFSQLIAGISIGSLLLLIALGLTFTFGQMNVINMAHGEFIAAGAYTTYVLQTSVFAASATSLAFVLSIPIAFIVAGLLGLVLEVVLIKRLYGRPLDTLLVTWGVSLMLQQLYRDLFGAPNVQVKAPTWLQDSFNIGQVTVSYSRLFIVVLVLVALVAIWFFSSRTVQGTRMRAVVQNRQLAEASGINSPRVDRTTFFIGSGLAGIAGVGITLLGSIGPSLGSAYIIDAFLVVVVGGLGQLRGAVIAAFVLGILNSFVELEMQSSLAKVIVFAVIIAFLQIRPQGLAVQKTRALA
ncbi:MAG: urea ABC transporter permease subunit UrtB [Solirubrobacteraceae bacterium]|nr:urea ABC transporter permease subunit UrtB [Patulibacter sp.]